MRILTCLISSFLILSFAGCKNEKEEINPNDHEAIFEKVWKDFDQNYPYFELKGVDWDSVYEINRPKVINGQTSVRDLIDILAQITLSLKDLHVRFAAAGEVFKYDNGEQFLDNSPENAVNYLTTSYFESPFLLVGSIRNSSIKYARIKTLSTKGDYEPVYSLISELSNNEALILDLRNNGGGNESVAGSIAGKLVTEEKTFKLVRYRNGPDPNDFGEWIKSKIAPNKPVSFDGDIIVLTNRGVVSSAEGFSYMLKSLPNTVFVGDTTRGSSANPVSFTLSNGWSYTISSWQVVSPDFVFLEDRGIAPDHVVINTEESMEEGRDLIFEEALRLINQ